MSSLKVKRALLSVSDKAGLVDFSKALNGNGVELISTGGTKKELSNAGLKVESVSDFTGFPEVFNGRVKTLHPLIEGGILADWSNPEHVKEASENNIKHIQLIACNLYPFQKTVEANSSVDDVIENIDVGGPTLVRGAAKNYKNVAVLTSPDQYDSVLAELKENDFSLSLETRRDLARQAFSLIAEYDSLIANWFESKGDLPENFFLSLKHALTPKYGENPTQKAKVFKSTFKQGILDWKPVNGDTPSFNNLMDAGKANLLLSGFEDTPTVLTVKHGIISGFSLAPTLKEAYSKASECDPSADYGGVIVMNRECDLETAELIAKPGCYREIVCAPSFSEDAVKVLKAGQKKPRRLFNTTEYSAFPFDLRVVDGAFLLQEKPNFSKKLSLEDLSFPTKLKPSSEDLKLLLVAHEVVRRVPSNGMLVCDGVVSDGSVESFWTYGVGSSTKRSRAAGIALRVAGDRARGALMASDGFFPFPDSVEEAGNAGVKAIIQPGGSIRDQASIDKADELGLSMAFSHARIFSH